MFNTLKKLRPKSKDKKNKQRKDKKMQQLDNLNVAAKHRLVDDGKRPSLPSLAVEEVKSNHAAHPSLAKALDAHGRRHSCFPALEEQERRRRPSLYSRRSSGASTCSAEGLRVRRLIEIAQIDKYIENLKKSVDSTNIACVPSRLCCAQMLKAVLQRRERQYVYEYLHSNRSSSESDISMKSKESESKLKHGHSVVTFSDDIVDNDNNNNSSSSSSNKNKSNDSNNNNNSSNDNDNTSDKNNNNNNNTNNKIVASKDSDCIDCHGNLHRHELLSERLAADNRNNAFVGDTRDSEEQEEEEERVPGALLKAYDSDGTRLTDSDSDEYSGRYKKKRSGWKSKSKSKRGSIALYPPNFEIF